MKHLDEQFASNEESNGFLNPPHEEYRVCEYCLGTEHSVHETDMYSREFLRMT